MEEGPNIAKMNMNFESKEKALCTQGFGNISPREYPARKSQDLSWLELGSMNSFMPGFIDLWKFCCCNGGRVYFSTQVLFLHVEYNRLFVILYSNIRIKYQ